MLRLDTTFIICLGSAPSNVGDCIVNEVISRGRAEVYNGAGGKYK